MAAFGSQRHPRKCPTVGAGSSQREDSPARPIHHTRLPCPRGNTIDGYGGGGVRMRIWVRGVCSDVACRVAIMRRIAIDGVPRR